MCDELSWIELPNGTLLYLTTYDLFDTPQGAKVRTQLCRDDWVGHAAIRMFYQDTVDFRSSIGKVCECPDFSRPSNFPAELARAVLDGRFAHFSPKEGLLLPAKWDALYAEYKPKWDALYAEYKPKRDALYAEYKPKRDALYAEYKPKWDALDADRRIAFWKTVADPTNRTKAWRSL